MKRIGFACLFLCLTTTFAAHPVHAQTETVLYNFTGGSDGSHPSGLTPDGAGNFYGTTAYGGTNGDGTVFKLSPNGRGGWNETMLYSFCSAPSCTDGANPIGPVILDSAGNLYGIANGGVYASDCAYGCGVVFELSLAGTSWTETVLYSFANAGDGAGPINLIMDPAGNLYGTTIETAPNDWAGTVFELMQSGGDWTERVIYNPDANIWAGITMDAAGNIFGVTATTITVFKLSPSSNGVWTPTVIKAFPGAYCYENFGTLGTPVLDSAGNLYVTATNDTMNIGRVYKLIPGKNGEWTNSILYSFEGNQFSSPDAIIMVDAAGNIYGTTSGGDEGNLGWGTVFELVAPGYTEKVLWTFDGTDGALPVGGVIQEATGNLYGTTSGGGPSLSCCPGNQYNPGYGVVFEMTGLPAPTTNTLTSSLNPSTHGQAVTFTAVVTSIYNPPPDGETVSFMKGKTLLGTGTLSGGLASFTTSALPLGTTAVTAVYGGDANFPTSTSNTVNQIVKKPAGTTTALSSSLNPSTYGQAVTFTATVTPPPPDGETVTFKGITSPNTAMLSGGTASITTSALKVGTTAVTAVYAGDASFAASKSAALSQVVGKATTTTTLTSSLNPSAVGQSVTFTVTVTPEYGGTVSGNVKFYDGTTLLKSVAVSGGSAAFTTSKLKSGTHSITATYNGSASFSGSSSAALTQTVN
jgi:uncharacterized repeat protein (TIGR03803 family)